MAMAQDAATRIGSRSRREQSDLLNELAMQRIANGERLRLWKTTNDLLARLSLSGWSCAHFLGVGRVVKWTPANLTLE